ncbi:MAG: PAS domain-containing sensor histidine kinase [Gammaproteobacteria bacterium]
MTFDRRITSRFVNRNASWLALCAMIAAIAANEVIRSYVGYSPPGFILFSAALLFAGLSGFRAGVASALLLCSYLTYLTIIQAGPPLLTSNFMQLGMTSLGILAVACGLGLSTERYRALISAFEQTDSQLKESRDELEKRVDDATRELRLSESRLKRAQQVSRMGSWERNLDTGDVWWSDERFRLHGLSPGSDTPSYQAFLDRIVPEDRSMVEEKMNTTWTTGASTSFEFKVSMPDDTVRTILSYAEMDTGTDGEKRIINGIAQDVTELRQADERIRRSEARLREAQSVAHMGSFERDLKTDEGVWSDELYRIFAVEPTEALSYDAFLERIHPDDRDRVVDLARRAVEEGQTFDSQYRIVLPDGDERIIRATAEVRYDEDGTPIKFTGTGQDVTERIELEREVVAISERERNRIGTDLHDGLGQELTGISLALQSLARQLVREESPHVEPLQSIVAMVQNSISETRGFARQLTPVFLAEQGLSAALMSLAEDVDEHSAATCRAHSNFDEEIHDPEVATHLYRIAQEGISNALKHGAASNIDLSYGRDGDSLYLEIVDDGAGIRKDGEFAEGLGLRSMRFRAHMLHGRLDVGQRTHGGTRVRCSCPYRFQ